MQEKKQIENAYEEKYGKGLKMLKMMGGFKVGKGLGKEEQGIVNPVEAELKKDNNCLGVESQKIEKA